MQNGKEYWFTTREKFEKGIEEGKFLEYAYVHSNIYGTSLKVHTPYDCFANILKHSSLCGNLHA